MLANRSRLIVAVVTIVSLSVLALAPSVSASSPQTSFSLAKTCDGLGTCTVVTSNAAALPPGTTETYLGPEFGDPVLSSRVVIASPYSGGGTATGRCAWPLRSASGTCTFAGGTGSLAGFHANLTVTANADFSLFFWDGAYRL
jgi:hypothetical protein